MPRVSSHHRDVEGPQVGELRDLTGDVAPLAQRQRGADASGVCGILHVLQALRPGRGTHQPQEDQDRCDQKVLQTSVSTSAPADRLEGLISKTDTHKNGSKVRILVDVHVAQVHQQSHHAVQEADDGDAEEKLCRGGGVSHHVRRGDRAVANRGVSFNERDLA